MIITTLAPNAAAGDAGELDPLRAVSVNIRPLLESVEGLLSGAEIDAWFAGFDRANEGRGFYLELTGEGEPVINPMVNSNSAGAELELEADMGVWAREYGGEAYGASVMVRLPDGSRVRPDAS